MSTTQILFNADLIVAGLVYGLAILIVLPLSDRLHKALEHAFLQWQLDHIAMSLLQAMAYRAIYRYRLSNYFCHSGSSNYHIITFAKGSVYQ